MSRGGLLSAMLAAAAGSLILCGSIHAQALRFPKRCGEHVVAKRHRPVFLDSVTFPGVSFPLETSRSRLVALLRKRAKPGGPQWLPRVWHTVRSAWTNDGYFQAVVDVKTQAVSSSATARHFSLRISVDPGPQYRVGVVRVLDANPGQKLAFSHQRLRDLMPIHPGQILDAGKVSEGLRAIRHFYATNGYIKAAAVSGFHIDTALDRVSFFVLLDQGKQYRVGRLQILGLDPNLKPLLTSKLSPGAIFNWGEVVNFYRREKLLLLPGLSPSDDQIYPNPKTHKVDVVLDFRACPESSKHNSPRDVGFE